MTSTHPSIPSCLLNAKRIQERYTDVFESVESNTNHFDAVAALYLKPNPSSPSGLFTLPISLTDLGQICSVSNPVNSLNHLDNVGNFILHNQLIM